MAELDTEVRRYYERGREIDRLRGGFPSGPLEFARTQEILLRSLAPPPLDILDVGGGPGAYAAWLADRGDRVHVVDPVAIHVEQAEAAHPLVTAELGDARQLRQPDASVDAVLLLGPLYHLIDRRDRLDALAEARRVVRPGGLVVAAAISRFAALLDLLVRLDRLHESSVWAVVADAVETGVFRGSEGGLFTTAYFHLPRELVGEVEAAGFVAPHVVSVEGPGAFVADFERRWADPERRETLLRAARAVEDEPEMLAASSHFLVIARRPAEAEDGSPPGIGRT